MIYLELECSGVCSLDQHFRGHFVAYTLNVVVDVSMSYEWASPTKITVKLQQWLSYKSVVVPLVDVIPFTTCCYIHYNCGFQFNIYLRPHKYIYFSSTSKSWNDDFARFVLSRTNVPEKGDSDVLEMRNVVYM